MLAWDEDRSSQTLPRVTPAHVSFGLPGLDGSVKAEYLMTYLPEGNASFIFTDTIVAKDILGKSGSFITQGKGTFDAKTYSVEGKFDVIEGTGTDELSKIKGNGSFRSSPVSEYVFDLTV